MPDCGFTVPFTSSSNRPALPTKSYSALALETIMFWLGVIACTAIAAQPHDFDCWLSTWKHGAGATALVSIASGSDGWADSKIEVSKLFWFFRSCHPLLRSLASDSSFNLVSAYERDQSHSVKQQKLAHSSRVQ